MASVHAARRSSTEPQPEPEPGPGPRLEPEPQPETDKRTLGPALNRLRGRRLVHQLLRGCLAI